MFSMQYSHRLPSDYDMTVIRQRAARRGPLWDDTQGLAFKGFVATEKGRFGATANLYSSVYLWIDAAAAANFLMGERFQAVIDSFGRPNIETWLPLDARIGKAKQALSLYRETTLVAPETDREALFAAERERNREIAAQSDTVAVVVALDLQAWQQVRFTLSSAEPDPTRPGNVYEVLHLAKPELARLP
jgi:hypothetical protein